MAGFLNWLYRVQIAGHYCTNRAAQTPRHTGPSEDCARIP